MTCFLIKIFNGNSNPIILICLYSGGKEIRIWDAFSRSLLTKCGQYHKTVTCLCLSRNGKRLITGSLDQRVKIFDLVSYKVVHTMTYKSPILSIACGVSETVLHNFYECLEI